MGKFQHILGYHLVHDVSLNSYSGIQLFILLTTSILISWESAPTYDPNGTKNSGRVPVELLQLLCLCISYNVTLSRPL